MSTIGAIPVPARPAKLPLHRLVGQAPWGVLDQMLISASNMCVTVLLARELGQDGFGLFVVVFSVLLLLNSIQDGLITQAHNVIGPTCDAEGYRAYTASTAVAQVAMSLGFAALVMLAAAGLWAWGSAAAPLVFALAWAVPAWQCQEFARRVLYTEGRVAVALGNDVIAYGGQAVVIAGLCWRHELTAAHAIYAIAGCSAAAAAVGWWRLRSSLRARPTVAEAMRNWTVGKWLAGGELVSVWLGDGTLVYLAAWVAGPGAAGAIRAVHTIFGPTRVMVMAIYTMLPIRMARSRQSGGDATLRSQVGLAMAAALPPFGVFCVFAAIFAEPILRFVFGGEFANDATVLRLYAIAMMLLYAGMIVNSGLRARHATRRVFVNRLLSSLTALVVGAALIALIGVNGAVLGMAAGYLVQVLLHGRDLLRLTRPTASAPAAAERSIAP